VNRRSSKPWTRFGLTPRPMGRGPAPLGGRLEALAELVAERRDATLAEHAAMLAARTGERRSLDQAWRP
jgi:hypothetical protein